MTQEIVCVLNRVAVVTGGDTTVDTGEDNCECAAIVIIGSGNSSGEARGGGDKIILIKRRPGFCDYLLIIASATIIKYIMSYKIELNSIVIVNRQRMRVGMTISTCNILWEASLNNRQKIVHVKVVPVSPNIVIIVMPAQAAEWLLAVSSLHLTSC